MIILNPEKESEHIVNPQKNLDMFVGSLIALKEV